MFLGMWIASKEDSFINKVMVFVNDNPDAVAAIASTVAAIIAAGALAIALVTILVENRRERFYRGIELIINLEERYNTDEMQQAVRTAAAYLIGAHRRDSTTSAADVQRSEKELLPELATVLNFFQFIARLANSRNVLDKDLVWNNFYHRMYAFWTMSEEHTEPFRQRNKVIWRDIPDLLIQLRSFTIEEYRKRDLEPPDLPTEDDLISRLQSYVGLESHDKEEARFTTQLSITSGSLQVELDKDG